VPLLVVLKFNFVFFLGFFCAVYWQVFALQNWAWFLVTGNSYSLPCLWLLVPYLVSLSLFTCQLLLSSAKRKNRAFVTVLVLYRCFLLGFFIRAVLRIKFIELGYSCLKVRAWQSFSLCFRA